MNPVTLVDITTASDILQPNIVKTPTLPMTSDRWRTYAPDIRGGAIKMELFQQAGSFKARGAYLGLQALTQEARRKGVVTASAGNHALAVSWAARKMGVSARIAMPKATDPVRVKGCREMGAEVVLCEDIKRAFDVMEQSMAEDGLSKIHPYDGQHMTLGAATCGKEFIEAHPDLEVIIVPVGGGGLIGGVAAAAKLAKPDIEVIGIEPVGADAMYQSLKLGHPMRLDGAKSIADSLAAPITLPYSFDVVKTYVDYIVHIEEDALRSAMSIYHDVLGLTVEPACASGLAGLLGPLRNVTAGKNVGLIACGSNIGLTRYQEILNSK